METVEPTLTEAGIDYRPKSYEHGYYRMSQIKQITGGDTLPAPLTNVTQITTFELPVKVFNFAKSQLVFTMTAENVTVAATESMAFHAIGCPAIDRLSLFTRAGIFLQDIVDFNFFTNTVLPYTTSVDEIKTKKIGFMGNTAAADTAIADSSPVGLIQPGESLVFGPTLSSSVIIADGTSIKSILDGNQRNTNLADTNRFPRSLTEPRYIHNNTYANAINANNFSALRYVLKFKDLPHCLMGMNKDLFFGETLILQVTWAPATQIAYEEVRLSGASTGVIGTSVYVSNLNLYLAIETNRVVAETVMRQASVGLKLIVPYVYTIKMQTANAVLQSIQHRLNRGHGRAILKIYHVIHPTANIDKTTYLHTSDNIVSFYTLMDNERLQDNVLVPADYTHLPHFFHVPTNCCLTTPNAMNYNFVWIDDWTGAPACEWRKTDSAECALPLEQERIWNILFTQGIAGAVTNRTFVITQKLLTITQQMITLI